MNEMSQRLDYLVGRLRTVYDGIGHSSGRPYVYFIYPPEAERALRRLIAETLRDDEMICYYHIDLLPLTMESISGQEERRQQLLNDPMKGRGAAVSLMRLWARALKEAIRQQLETSSCEARPVIVLSGLAALHPLGHPTALMEMLADEEPRDPKTGHVLPIVLFVPGTRPPQSSRIYYFLGQPETRLSFYRGEEA